MIKKQTWILLALFAALAGFALFLKYKPASEGAAADATPSATTEPVEFLFPAEEGVVTSILIQSREGGVIEVKRSEDAWVVTQPVETKADQASVEEAASQATALTILHRLDLEPAVVGLKSPAYTITVGFSSGTFVVAQVGDVTPTESGYYVRKDDGSILVIDKYGMDALINLVLYPPYEETPTPSPAPETEPPTPEASATPTVTKTP
jgi:hypothetical protein